MLDCLWELRCCGKNFPVKIITVGTSLKQEYEKDDNCMIMAQYYGKSYIMHVLAFGSQDNIGIFLAFAPKN